MSAIPYLLVDRFFLRPFGFALILLLTAFEGQAQEAKKEGEQKGKPVVVEFSTKNNVSRLEAIELFVRMPAGLKEGENPKGILALAVYSNEAKAVKKRLSEPSSSSNYFKFADKHGLIVVSWPTATLYDNANSFGLNTKSMGKGDDDFGKSLKAWDQGMALLCNRLNVPYRDVLICGVSRGAQWAHRFALRMPEKFLAVHAHVNSSYEEPQKDAKSVLWLITTGNQEHGYEASKVFYRRCRELGFPIVYKSQANLGHSSSPQIEKLGLEFFEFALKLKEEREQLRAQQQADPMKAKSVQSSGFPEAMLKPFFDPPYVGDLLNQEVFPSNKKSEVASNLQVPIPTKELAAVWGFFEEEPSNP